MIIKGVRLDDDERAFCTTCKRHGIRIDKLEFQRTGRIAYDAHLYIEADGPEDGGVDCPGGHKDVPLEHRHDAAQVA